MDFHPMNFKKSLCKKGNQCRETYCPDSHSPSEFADFEYFRRFLESPDANVFNTLISEIQKLEQTGAVLLSKISSWKEKEREVKQLSEKNEESEEKSVEAPENNQREQSVAEQKASN